MWSQTTGEGEEFIVSGTEDAGWVVTRFSSSGEPMYHYMVRLLSSGRAYHCSCAYGFDGNSFRHQIPDYGETICKHVKLVLEFEGLGGMKARIRELDDGPVLSPETWPYSDESLEEALNDPQFLELLYHLEALGPQPRTGGLELGRTSGLHPLWFWRETEQRGSRNQWYFFAIDSYAYGPFARSTTERYLSVLDARFRDLAYIPYIMDSTLGGRLSKIMVNASTLSYIWRRIDETKKHKNLPTIAGQLRAPSFII